MNPASYPAGYKHDKESADENAIIAKLITIKIKGATGDLENTILTHSNKHESFTRTHLIPLRECALSTAGGGLKIWAKFTLYI